MKTIILDTDVLSAVMRPDPPRAVVSWLDNQSDETIWTTAVTVFEIRFGLELLAPGRRRRRLEEAFAYMLQEELGQRVLNLDADAARHAALLSALRQKEGRRVDLRDTLIVGIALARRASIATRNLRHFSDLDVPVIDPWSA